MGLYRRLQFSRETFRNVSKGSKHLARNPVNPVSSSPIPGKISHFSDEWNLGFCGSSLISSRYVHLGGGLSHSLNNVLPIRAGKRSYKFPNFNPKRSNKWFQKPRYILLTLLFGSGMAIYLCNLETIPCTNRTHFVLTSIETEKLIGETLLERLKQRLYKGKILPANHPESLRVDSIAKNLIEPLLKGVLVQSDPGFGSHDQFKMDTKWVKVSWKNGEARPYTRNLEGLQWEVTVVDDPSMVNAWCFPGGKIVVANGLLRFFETDAEIATFIGHSVGHLVARHTAEGMTKDLWKTVIKRFLYHFVTPGVVESITLLKSRPRTPQMEIEAHYIGIMLMASAGYDPRTAISTHEKLWKLYPRMALPPCMTGARLHPQSVEKAMKPYKAKRPSPVI